ncbi:MAG TPA: alanine--tRNA ligase [Candidatus Lokiarchaeia archaeon]|nr:alanine--tRNA ligase [Candidatus Lokiarchaeia archaeon]
MIPDKEQKKAFKKVASQDPDRFYPTQKLSSLGYMRKLCNCGQYFWTVNESQETCGDPACSGGFKVTYDNPSKVQLTYVEVWKKIVELLEPRGYTPLKRYPVVSRWNPTTDFTIASIAAFQPYVISGEAEPPAKKLLIPQFCLRFNDVVNVGVTGSHCTGFVMIGQHMFVPPEEWDQEQAFTDILDFLLLVVGLPPQEITIHEDAWAGGGNFGPCMEFFSRGVELLNQVYMMFEQTEDGAKDLSIKVLDMGMGMERVAWFSQGTPTLYDATFPLVLERLRERTGVVFDADLFKQFSQYSAYLNFDEVDDINAAWARVAGEMGMDATILQSKVLPMTALYSIAEHARALLFALHDGMLPSNVGGGYNLRMIFRRAMGFLDQMGWDIDLGEVCEWHAEELREIFPEVSENLPDVREILAVEKGKFEKTKAKAQRVVENIIGQNITIEMLINLYDSKGINPEVVRDEARKLGKNVVIPDDFYAQVFALHEQAANVAQTHKAIDVVIPDLPDTRALYFQGYDLLECQTRVAWVQGPYVVLEETVAYPTSGGQLNDVGTINSIPFIDVNKQKNLIVHQLDQDAPFSIGEEVTVQVDPARRMQLAQHHTATHIINAAARAVLGAHINQYGARKTERRASLDITHYAPLSSAQMAEIQGKANEIVDEDLPVNTNFFTRREAEDQYGMRIYQGGAVPGNNIRIVEIPNVDVEACGGTHLHSTGEVGRIKVLSSRKIQDGIVRLTYVAGQALERLEAQHQQILDEVCSALGVPLAQVPGRARELVSKWKALNKAQKAGKAPDPADLELKSTEESDDASVLPDLQSIFETKVKDLSRTIQKMIAEWTETRDRVGMLSQFLGEDQLEQLKASAIDVNGVPVIAQAVPGANSKAIQDLAINLLKQLPGSIIFLETTTNKGLAVLLMGDNQLVADRGLHLGNALREVLQDIGGRGGGGPANGQGLISSPDADPDAVITAIVEKLRTLL